MFLNFDELTSSKASSKPQTAAGPAGTEEQKQPQKKYYEDPTLAEDEHRMNAELDEKRRVEELLRPASIDLNSPPGGQELSKNPSQSQNPHTATSEIKEADEEEGGDEK